MGACFPSAEIPLAVVWFLLLCYGGGGATGSAVRTTSTVGGWGGASGGGGGGGGGGTGADIVVDSTSSSELLQDLGLDTLPDIKKINISLSEYTRMMSVYLGRMKETQSPNTIPNLIIYKTDQMSWRRRINSTRMRFTAAGPTSTGTTAAAAPPTVQSAELRLLVPALPGRDTVRVRLYQLMRTHPARRLITEQTLYTSRTHAKWCDFDVTSVVTTPSIIHPAAASDYRLEIVCVDCTDLQAPAGYFRPLEAAISLLTVPSPSPLSPRHRSRRSSAARRYPLRRPAAGDCRGDGSGKSRCCLHSMPVQFSKLTELPVGSLIQPRVYEAGFCRGRCPLNFNHATNHSRIQSLVHKIDRGNVPRVCCSPSKLAPLEILRVNPADTTKLIMERWDNMIVKECACA